MNRLVCGDSVSIGIFVDVGCVATDISCAISMYEIPARTRRMTFCGQNGNSPAPFQAFIIFEAVVPIGHTIQ